MIEDLYKGQLALLPAFAIDADELLPRTLAKTLETSISGTVGRMKVLATDYLKVLENDKKEMILTTYDEVLKAQSDPQRLEILIASTLNDTVSAVISGKFKQLLTAVLPDSESATMRAAVKEMAEATRTP